MTDSDVRVERRWVGKTITARTAAQRWMEVFLMVEHNPYCVKTVPDCICRTCKNDDGAKGDCCLRHKKPCLFPCPDYEAEEGDSDG